MLQSDGHNKKWTRVVVCGMIYSLSLSVVQSWNGLNVSSSSSSSSSKRYSRDKYQSKLHAHSVCMCVFGMAIEWHSMRATTSSASTSPLLLNGSTAQSVPSLDLFLFYCKYATAATVTALLLQFIRAIFAPDVEEVVREGMSIFFHSFFYGQTKTRWNYLNECAIKTCSWLRCPCPRCPLQLLLRLRSLACSRLL